ncbi:MAG: six-hairpin glycosidase [Bacteroidetes bacterium GWF2_40_14]|nr:MAG: six-hairpin glycosidase [Bacteroidetes bacterium GWF2_40_14]
MKKISIFLFLLMALSVNVHGQSPSTSKDYPISPVSFTSVSLTDNFWAPRIKINQDVTIPIALRHCYNTGRVDNFRKAAKLIPGYFNTQFTFDDTDIYKIIEGASYSVQMFPNACLEARIDTLIRYIALAQEPDGYLFTARTAGKPGDLHKWVGEKRWEKDPDLSHELYNCGHLYEAAVAHYQATGKRTLLDVAIKNADLLVHDFGPGKLTYEPGHQIVEMGLAKMYRITGKREYLDLARFFLDLKGNGHSGEYSQTHKPVIEQDEAVGHAVRAAYMYSGMADVAALTGDQNYLTAIDRIWENVVGKKLYITGGIGATGNGEAFGKNYELPNMSAYCETCAAIANVFWNHRLFLLHGDSKYYDILERTLYNGLISGIQLTGDKFFYPNPLQSIGQHSRSEWFGCACCPSNVCRFIPSVSGYVYATKGSDIYVNLFIESNAKVNVGNNMVNLLQHSNYPWSGDISIIVNPEKRSKFGVKIRIPGWVKGKPMPGNLYSFGDSGNQKFAISVNGKQVVTPVGADGYANIIRKWSKGDCINLLYPMEIRRIIANDAVEADRGKVSISRGPLVYCLEWPDNEGEVLNTVLDDSIHLSLGNSNTELGSVITIKANASSAYRTEDGKVVLHAKNITAIPYYSWANRGSGEMIVWIPRNQNTTRPLSPKTICSEATVTASTPNRSLITVNDGFWPSNSNDREVPFYSLWPKTNNEEWIEYRFRENHQISQALVYWFDDGPWGGCRIPLIWKVLYESKNGNWQEVSYTDELPVSKKNEINKVKFNPVNTSAVRLLFKMPEKESSAIYEFEVK